MYSNTHSAVPSDGSGPANLLRTFLVELSGSTERNRRFLAACVSEQLLSGSSTFEALEREMHVLAYANLA